jgi:hypothetical protein
MLKKPLFRRVVLAFLAGAVLGILINEISFIFLREDSRPPERVELTIPLGTSELVAAGQQPPGIPEGMTFVVGDTLVVHNLDVVDHVLGPLWIPAGSAASLALDSAGQYADRCSFRPTKYFNLDVKAPLDLSTRLYGIAIISIPLGIVFALYAAIAWPVKKN